MSERLVPSNASELEVALDESLGSRIDVLETPIPEASRPLDAPADFLPFIAWGRGVGVWEEDWPEDRKRARAHAAVEIDRLHGTLAGIEAELDFVPNARIVRAILPPQGFFAAPSFDESDRQWREWMAGLPEVRIFERQEAGLEGNHAASIEDEAGELLTVGMFLGAEDGESTFFAGAPALDRYQAIIIRNGVEQEVDLRTVKDPRYGRSGDVFEIAWTEDAGAGFFCDDVQSADGFIGGSPEALNFRRLSLGFAADEGEPWNLVAPTSDIQDVSPAFGWFEAANYVCYFAGETLQTHFVSPLGSDDFKYWSFRIMETPDDWAPPGSFVGFDRLGMPPYTAELVVDISGVAGLDQAYASAFFAGATYACGAPDPSLMNEALDAIAAAQSLRDIVLVDFDTAPKLRGPHTFADLVR